MKDKKQKIDRLRLLAIFILMLGIVYFYINLFFPFAIPFFIKTGTFDRPLNMLIVGTDVTFIAETKKVDLRVNGRSDSIMLLHFDPIKNRINAISIPRDSFVQIPGYGYNKINASFALGGIDLTKQTIEKHILINTKGIEKLVDLLGGVWVDVEKDLYYVDHAQDLNINLKKGYQKLSGKQANGYTRFRHDAMGDIGRMLRQQQFTKALIKNLVNPVSIIKAPFIIDVIVNNIKSDLSLKEFILLANSIRAMPSENIRTQTIPADPASNWAGSVLILKQGEMNKLIKENF